MPDIYRDALESMVWQFGYKYGSGTGNSFITTGGLSALEECFEALGWADPHEVPDGNRICDALGCGEFVTNQGSNWRAGGYWCLCSEHGFSKSKQPAMKQRAIEREASRDPITHVLPVGS